MYHKIQSNPMPSEAHKNGDESRVPFLEDENEEALQEKKLKKWLEGRVDSKESKKQLSISLLMIFINLSYYMIPLISVMFAGHLGELELAGSTLANSWSSITGLAFMVGLSGSLETLCGQGFGSQLYGTLGVYLQSSCIISLFFSFIIAIIWWYTEPILILLHQSSSIANAAALYMKYFIPGIFAYGFIQNILRFFQTQSIVVIPMICALIPAVLHVGIAYVLVHLTSLGYKGAPLAASISLWISLLMLVLYVKFAKVFKFTYTGLSSESFKHVFTNLKLALPSAAMVCLEDWAFEILVLLAGLMPNSETSTSLIAIVNTEAIAFMMAYGLSAAPGKKLNQLEMTVSTLFNPSFLLALKSDHLSKRVSNEIRAGNPEKARRAMWVTLKLSVPVVLLVVVCLTVERNVWAGFFSSSSYFITEFASMTPLLVISIILDSIQGIFSGVSRGCGWQHLAMYTNLGMFYLVGMPISCLLAFKFELYSKGLWIGLICGLSFQAATLFLLTISRKWTKMELSADGSKEDTLPV